MSHRPRRAALAAVLAAALLALAALWAPGATAQPTPPPATAQPTLAPAQPAALPGAPAGPGATPSPTRTAAELIGVGDLADTLGDLARYGLLGALGLLILGGAAFLLYSYWKGWGSGAEKLGERHAEGALRAAAAPAVRRAAAAQRQSAEEAGLAAYLAWVQEELKHLPIIPIRSTQLQEQLLVEDVYVRLRVVERAQIEGFRKLVRGDFDPAGEYRLRQEAFEALEGSRGVYRLLSDVARLPRGEERRRDQAQPADETTFTRLLLIGDAGSGKTTTLQYGALVLAHARSVGDPAPMCDLLDLHLGAAPLPLYIRLTLVATYVREAQTRARPEDLPAMQGAPSRLLLEWLESYTQAQMGKSGQTLSPGLLACKLADGGCLVLLDGLDETGDSRERDYMQRLIANLVQDYGQNRQVVRLRNWACQASRSATSARSRARRSRSCCAAGSGRCARRSRTRQARPWATRSATCAVSLTQMRGCSRWPPTRCC